MRLSAYIPMNSVTNKFKIYRILKTHHVLVNNNFVKIGSFDNFPCSLCKGLNGQVDQLDYLSCPPFPKLSSILQAGQSPYKLSSITKV